MSDHDLPQMALRCGRADVPPGLLARECPVAALATLLARARQTATLAAAIGQEFGVALPTRPRVVHGGGVSFIWSGPGHWLVHADGEPAGLERRLVAAAGSCAAVVDQSDSRVLLDLAGARVRDVLAKGLAVDLDAGVFDVGDVAIGTIAHVGVQLWQTGPAPVYRIAVARSYYASWRDWLVAAAGEYGGLLLPAA